MNDLSKHLPNKVIETKNLVEVFTICYSSQTQKRIGMLIGLKGYGKSTALRHYCDQFYSATYYLEAAKSYTPKKFWMEMYKSVLRKPVPSNYPIYRLIESISITINSKAKNQLIIIDEASKLSSSAYEYLHEFHDKTKGNAGIVISGAPYVDKNLRNWEERNKNGIAEFRSRICFTSVLEEPTSSDKISVAKSLGVKDKLLLNGIANECQDFREVENRIVNYNMSKKLDQIEKEQKSNK